MALWESGLAIPSRNLKNVSVLWSSNHTLRTYLKDRLWNLRKGICVNIGGSIILMAKNWKHRGTVRWLRKQPFKSFYVSHIDFSPKNDDHLGCFFMSILIAKYLVRFKLWIVWIIKIVIIIILIIKVIRIKFSIPEIKLLGQKTCVFFKLLIYIVKLPP